MPEDNKYTASDVVRAAMGQNPVEVQKALGDMIVDKIQTTVADRKVALAQNLFGGKPGEEDEEVEDDGEIEGEEEIVSDEDLANMSDEELEAYLEDMDEVESEEVPDPEGDEEGGEEDA